MPVLLSLLVKMLSLLLGANSQRVVSLCFIAAFGALKLRLGGGHKRQYAASPVSHERLRSLLTRILGIACQQGPVILIAPHAAALQCLRPQCRVASRPALATNLRRPSSGSAGCMSLTTTRVGRPRRYQVASSQVGCSRFRSRCSNLGERTLPSRSVS